MRKIIYVLTTVLAIGFVGCNEEEFLEPTPYGLAGDATFFRNAADAQLAINAVYTSLRIQGDGFNGDHSWGLLGTDEVFKGGSGPADNPDQTFMQNYTLDPGNVGQITGRWANNYVGIRNANKVLENVPAIEMDEALKNRILGEAYFLRGVFYFDSAKYFGGLILLPENLATPEEYLEQTRSSIEETYATIEADLLKAVDLLPVRSSYAAEDIGRATKGAALGFLTRANAYQNNLPAVKNYAEGIFALNEYELAPTYSEIFTPEGENGIGSIFEVQFQEAGQGWGNARQGTANIRAFSPRQSTLTGWGFSQPRLDLVNEYETDDPRLDTKVFTETGQEYNPNPGDTNYFSRIMTAEPYSTYPEPGAPNDSPMNWRVLRLADIYLLYAESVASSDPELAITYLNLVRARAREGNAAILPDIASGTTGAALTDAIRHERRVEMSMEGLRRFDLIRWGSYDILTPLGFQEGKHELMPIPQTEIDNFTGNLQQNSGY